MKYFMNLSENIINGKVVGFFSHFQIYLIIAV